MPENYDIINAYNPFKDFSDKTFNSPLMFNNDKALYDENEFSKDYISEIIEQYKDKVLTKLKFEYDQFLSSSLENDNIRRDDYLGDLDIRLKSINPRKGKLQVEEYEVRLTQIEKHKEKFASFEKSILDKNNKDLLDNNLLFEKEINPMFEDNSSLFSRLMKSMDEETTIKGINDKLKKYKTEYYEFNSQLEIFEDCLKSYSNNNPNNLILLIEGFIAGMISFDKNGTYSQREIEYYSSLLKNISDNKIKSQKNELESSNTEKLKVIKDTLEKNTKLIEEKFYKINELIMAKNSLGKVFGQPKRIINEYLINMKMKVNQGIEGIEKQFNNIKNIIELNKQDDLSKSKNLRENLLSINNCIFYFGKYMEAFKPGFNYSLSRVTSNEEAEVVEINNKEEVLLDIKKQEEELKNLCILYFSPLSENINNDSKNKKEERIFLSELNSIDEKVRNECQKVYVGEYSKLIANNEKMPQVLFKYLETSKDELFKFRLNNIRVLRTISQNLFILSLSIGKCIFNTILNEYTLKLNEYNLTIKSIYLKNKEQSNNIKNEINGKLGPYLANPLYKDKLDSFVSKQKERNQKIVKEVTDSQIKLINNIEAVSDSFYKKITNLFESFLYLFDNMIFEEEYLDLGDIEDFKERKDYNFLLKLKEFNKELNLDSKRSIKKVFIGLDRNKLRINYAEKFPSILNSVLEGVNERIILLKNEYTKQLFSKSINAYRLDNNSNLIRERDLCFSSYFNFFNQIVSFSFNYYNKELQEEQDYYKSWEIEVNKLRIN